jgi:hypothetical protein
MPPAATTVNMVNRIKIIYITGPKSFRVKHKGKITNKCHVLNIS